MERQVKGIWIPIEIWESKELTWNEKILFLEIDSFTTKDKDCFFSNEHIAKLLGVTENSANRILSSLISKGYVVKTSFDGRRRFVKTAFSYDKAGYSQMNKQDNQERIGCYNNKEYIPNTSNNTDNKPYNIPPLPPKGKREVKKVDYDFVDNEYKEIFLEWLEYKKDRKESYKSEKAVKLCYEKLIKLSGNDPEIARQIVEQSMANNWAGLFELKKDNNYGKRNYDIERDSQQRKLNSAIAVSTRVQEAAAKRLAELKAAGVID